VAKTPAFQAGDPGSNPGRRTQIIVLTRHKKYGRVKLFVAFLL
jgi:hypothetical protein